MQISKKLKTKIYFKLREIAKKDLTHNLGPVVETEEKLICFVDNKHFKRHKLSKHNYTLCLFGSSSNLELAKTYKLDKPICYIIDELNIKDQRLCIRCFNSKDTEIIIRNSNLNDIFFRLKTEGAVIFQNNKIDCADFSFGFEIDAADLVIKDTKFENYSDRNLLKLTFCANSIKTYHSSVGLLSDMDVAIYTDNLELNDTNIMGNNITINGCNHIYADLKSCLKANEKIEVESNKIEQLKLLGDTIIVNGKDYSGHDFIIKKPQSDLEKERMNLLVLLEKIRSKYNNKFTNELEAHKNNIYNKPLSKVLKK